MPRKPRPEKPSAEILAPIPAEILDQIVRNGPLSAEESKPHRGVSSSRRGDGRGRE